LAGEIEKAQRLQSTAHENDKIGIGMFCKGRFQDLWHWGDFPGTCKTARSSHKAMNVLDCPEFAA